MSTFPGIPESGLNTITWAGTHLLIDASDIFSKQAKAKENYPQQKKGNGKEGKNAMYFCAQ